MFQDTAEGERQAELPLKFSRSWDTLPKAKVTRTTSEVPFAWAYTYTAFSLPFASAALELLGAHPGTTVFDPFVGSGTTIVAAARRGCAALGVDVSPFSSLLARSRLAFDVDPDRIASYLDVEMLGTTSSMTRLELLGSENSAYAENVIAAILGGRGLTTDQLWTELLADDVGDYDSEAVAILCLAIGARDCAKLVRGTNPIWFRRAPDTVEHSTISLKRASIELANTVCNDLMGAKRIARTACRIVNADINSTCFRSEFDICLTSPPYPNRLDYVVAHWPELSVLELVAPRSTRDVRDSMIGTTKMVSKNLSNAPEAWGSLCASVLQRILTHDSYASRRYYYHTYYWYFDRLYEALIRTVAALRRGARGVIVLQDSFYKDVNIPNPAICVEMLRSLCCSAEITRTDKIRTHVGRMSPSQNVYVPRKTFGESLVHFGRDF